MFFVLADRAERKHLHERPRALPRNALCIPLQGTLTSKEVHEVLKRTGKAAEFPFFERVYEICYEGAEVKSITTAKFYD